MTRRTVRFYATLAAGVLALGALGFLLRRTFRWQPVLATLTLGEAVASGALVLVNRGTIAMNRTGRVLERGQTLVRAIEALETINPTGPIESAITWLLLKAYRRRIRSPLRAHLPALRRYCRLAQSPGIK